MSSVDVDVLVVGAGVAGLSTALGLAGARRVLVVSAGDGSTRWAQGGIAAASTADDDPVDHAEDTAVAGAGACDPRALACLVEEGPLRLAELVQGGARFDRDAGGRFDRTLEGGHHHRRVVHAGGDATGAEVSRALTAVAETADLTWWHDATVTGLTTAPGPAGRQVTGATIRRGDAVTQVTAGAVVLATGGIGHAYPASTNPAGVSGEGIALALLAGATLHDVEFVQFHPTALYTGAVAGQVPLVSEALRGEGAVLLDAGGRAFMAGRHPLADLAPRDVVARAIEDVMTLTGAPHVWLDATGVHDLAARFPTIVASCHRHGIDPVTGLIPVAPAEHFLCGGIATDRWGATDVAGLYAVGEAAATGVHGANRLASNSLLEGLVFGRRVAARLVLDPPVAATGDTHDVALEPLPVATQVARRVLGAHAGVVRTPDGLATAARELAAHRGADPAWLVASAVVAAATARRESRGCHFRTDHPTSSDLWRRPVAVRLDASGVPVAGPARAEATPRREQAA